MKDSGKPRRPSQEPEISWATFAALTMAMACSAPNRSFVEGSGGGGASPTGPGTGGSGGGGLTGGSDSGGAGGSGGGECPPPELPKGPVVCQPNMVSIARPLALGNNYCVDAYEVSQADYAAFLASQPENVCGSACAWNSSFDPTDGVAQPSVACDAYVWDPAGAGANVPVVCVDWCDAAAYCEARGKRLCGALEGGPVSDMDAGANVEVSQWFRACGGSPDGYPYSSTYEGNICNDEYDALEDVRDGTGVNYCETPTNIYDLSGNANEWEDACSGYVDEDDTCLARGGGPEASAPAAACGYLGHEFERMTRDPTIGFRCCQG
jgi:hypothetical protein